MTPQNILISDLVARSVAQGVSDILSLKNFNTRVIATNAITEDDLNWADCYMGFAPPKNTHFGNIKWFHGFGAGINQYTSLSPWPAGIKLTRTTGKMGRRIAEYCLTRALMSLQNTALYAKQQQSQTWEPALESTLQGKTILCLGTGSVGQEIGRLFSAMGCTTIGLSKSGRAKPNHFHQTHAISDNWTILQQADIIIAALPLTADTQHIINTNAFNHCQNATFINIGRGPLVDTPALQTALGTNKIKHAYLDVFEQEPLPQSSPLWSHPNVTITPHIAAITTPEEAANDFLKALSAFQNNQIPENLVDLTRGY